jgi:hypothetical protein
MLDVQFGLVQPLQGRDAVVFLKRRRFCRNLGGVELELFWIFFGLGLWCFFWPVLRRWRSAGGFIGFWIVIELINGIGHPLWSIQQRSYTPGVITAPVLLILALVLLSQLAQEKN